MYFDTFPKILYDSKGNGQVKIVTNLLKRVAIRTKVKNNTSLFDTYTVQNGDTPESIADKLYDDPELHWVVLMVNDITDRYHQWPMYEQQFNTYVSEKYDNPDAVHHYEISQSSGDTSTKIEVVYISRTIVPAFVMMTTIPREYQEPLLLYNHGK